MLETARRCTSEHEQGRRQHTGRDRPSRAPADGCHAETPCQQMGKDNEVETPHRRGRIKQTPSNEHRREHQRLRVRHARMSAVMVGVPEWPVTGTHGRGQEAEEGVELVFGVPGHDPIADDPAADGCQPDCCDQAQRDGQSVSCNQRKAQAGSHGDFAGPFPRSATLDRSCLRGVDQRSSKRNSCLGPTRRADRHRDDEWAWDGMSQCAKLFPGWNPVTFCEFLSVPLYARRLLESSPLSANCSRHSAGNVLRGRPDRAGASGREPVRSIDCPAARARRGQQAVQGARYQTAR